MGRVVRAFAPGRTELAGNHTDHQGGRAIAATLDCGIAVEARPNGCGRVRLESAGFAPVDIDASALDARASERGTTVALVRGVVGRLVDAGVDVGGFDAVVTSTIPSGGGLSSSAAFELALLSAACALFGEGRSFAPAELATMAVQIERDYFGKPCGMLDQMAIACGGITVLDFSDASHAPGASPLSFDFEGHGYALCLVDTRCDHSRYTDEYARVARDMFDVARFLGASRLSEVPESAFYERFGDVRRALGDVPALRGLHYYHEMELVAAREEALRQGDVEAFIQATRRSGASSAQYLQNVSTADRSSQPAMVALALVDRAVGPRGACRIHGGGFGGTVQAFVPIDDCEGFARAVDRQLGEGACRRHGLSGAGVRVESQLR